MEVIMIRITKRALVYIAARGGKVTLFSETLKA